MEYLVDGYARNVAKTGWMIKSSVDKVIPVEPHDYIMYQGLSINLGARKTLLSLKVKQN